MSGYRGQFYYNNCDWDALQEFIDKKICYPGETIKVRLQTLSPIFHVGQFTVNQDFEIREGAKIVGKGKITTILRSDFKYWDYESFFRTLPANCKPYNNENLERVLIDFHYNLDNIEEIESHRFEINLSNPHSMLSIECVLKDKKMKPRPALDKICEIWHKELFLKNSIYKIHPDMLNLIFGFQLQFAICHDLYLTGKIVIKKSIL